MKYINIIEGNFISRPNRFIAKVLINGKEEMAHVKNTGRCKELLTDNAKVYLEDFEGRMGTRKMRYSLIGV
ncbi:MAG: DNA/RNA nuclease SfsA, partial [Anaerovoracaceae bacterium]